MSPYGTWALIELNYAIYDGLEIILKVTKNAKKVYVDILKCKWWWWMSLSLCPLSSIFFYFEVSPHFFPPNGFKRGQNSPWRFNHCVIWMWWSWKKSIQRHYPPCMSQVVLKAANSVRIQVVLKWVNFDANIHHVSLKWSWKKSFMGANFLLGLDLGLPLYSVGC